ncbi:VOC family protein [Actinomadura sp. 9N407]|uniref:VOC family protein n=1 Tax=Actinomadura sp. 9N407 TaxID=3375154 RepID=UPI0037C12BF9
MRPKVSNVAIDCTDMDAMIAFWGGLLAMKVTDRDEDWTDLEPIGEGGPLLSFQFVPEGKQAKNRIHFDLEVPDIHAAGERARELGATAHGEPMGDDPDRPFQVWLDPQGNEFCFVTA